MIGSPQKTRGIGLALGAVIVLGAGGTFLAMSNHNGRHGDHLIGQHMHSANGMDHDESNMPGLFGENASPEESEEIAVLFRNFGTITRKVENLPNGIRTVTRSSDQAVMDALVNHAVGMIDRVGQLNNPKIIIQSASLDIFFVRGEGIISDVEITDAGLVVVQTSDDPELVNALQTHAAEVSAMAERGMQAVHEMMMERGASH